MSFSAINTHINFMNSFSSTKKSETSDFSFTANESSFTFSDKSLFIKEFSKKNIFSQLNINNTKLDFSNDFNREKFDKSNDNLGLKPSILKNNLKDVVGNKFPIKGSTLPLNNLINNIQTGTFEINLRDLTGSLLNQNLMSFSSTLDLSANNSFLNQPTYQINTPTSNSLWGSHLQNQIRWFIGNNINRAEIFLTPPEFGKIFIRIDQKNDSVNLTISAQNNLLKDQLESSITKLKDLFEKQGLELVDVHISNEEDNQLFNYNYSEFNKATNKSIEENDIENPDTIKLILNYGIIDEFV